MTSTRPVPVRDLVREATDRVMQLVVRRGEPVVIVDSPPGAGKTRLVESIAAVGIHHGWRVAVVMPRAEQTFDFIRRFAIAYPGMIPQILQSAQRELPSDLRADRRLHPVAHIRDLIAGPGIVVGVAHKFVVSLPAFIANEFDLLICDEAYQLAYKDFAPLFQIAVRSLLVGDPGQLDPLIRVDTARFEAAPVKVHWPVPREVARRFAGAVPVVKLPVTMRLPQDTVDLVAPSFYPDLPFVSGAAIDSRRLEFSTLGMNSAIDRALDMMVTGKTIVALALPALDNPIGDAVDAEVAAAEAAIIARLLERRPSMGGLPLTARHLGCIDAHVASGAAVRHHLRGHRISTDDVKVDTPEIWQGGERPIMVVKHPLSGLSRLDAFSLNPGRWCVMLSRHQGGCIIVTRDGVGMALENHQHDCAARPMTAANAEWAGFEAHRRLWQRLEAEHRIVRVTS